jgi:hypothetical protein
MLVDANPVAANPDIRRDAAAATPRAAVSGAAPGRQMGNGSGPGRISPPQTGQPEDRRCR